MKHVITISAILLLFAARAVAHLPVLNDADRTLSKDDPYIVEDAEHSTAIFSTLSGDPQYYKIQSEVPFDFYVGITAPKNESCGLIDSFSFDILDAQFNRIDGRDGADFEWWAWYEEWGKKWYWVGPEIGADFKSDRRFEPGTYYIKVFNDANKGKYVLAIGDDERFGFFELLTLNRKVKKINAAYWDEADCP